MPWSDVALWAFIVALAIFIVGACGFAIWDGIKTQEYRDRIWDEQSRYL